MLVRRHAGATVHAACGPQRTLTTPSKVFTAHQLAVIKGWKRVACQASGGTGSGSHCQHLLPGQTSSRVYIEDRYTLWGALLKLCCHCAEHIQCNYSSGCPPGHDALVQRWGICTLIASQVFIHGYSLPRGIRCTLLICILRAEEQLKSPVKGYSTATYSIWWVTP